MPLTSVDQTTLTLTHGHHAACGVACVKSVLISLGVAPLPTDTAIFKSIWTTDITRDLGSTPRRIANLFKAHGKTVGYLIEGTPSSPIAVALSLDLRRSNATKFASRPPHQSGGPPFFIHFLKVKGANPAGHFVVGDGTGSYMDPGAPGGPVIAGLPVWLNFYDTGLIVVVW